MKAMQQALARAGHAVRQALRGTIQRLTGDRVMLAQVQGLGGEQFSRAEWVQQAGFRSRPLPGAQVIVVPLHGSSAHGVVIACANGKLFVTPMQDGETALFNEKDGHFIHLKNGKVIDVQCDTLNIRAAQAVNIQTVQFSATASGGASFTTPTLAASAKVTAGSDVVAAGNVADQGGGKTMAAMRAVFNGHKHNNGPMPDQQM